MGTETLSKKKVLHSSVDTRSHKKLPKGSKGREATKAYCLRKSFTAEDFDDLLKEADIRGKLLLLLVRKALLLRLWTGKLQ